jgi:hypothetical protein
VSQIEVGVRAMANGRQRRGGELGVILKAGSAAGVLAGASMLLFVMFAAGWRGFGVLAPVQAFAGLFLGRGALGGGWGPSLLGLAVHGAVSLSLGVLFTAIALRRTGPIESVGAGVMLAVIAWAVLTYVVVPLTNPALREVTGEVPIAWFGGNVVFGMVVALARQFVDVLRRPPIAAEVPAQRRAAGPARMFRSPRSAPRAMASPRLEPGREVRRAPRSRLRVVARVGTIVAAAVGIVWAARHAEA